MIPVLPALFAKPSRRQFALALALVASLVGSPPAVDGEAQPLRVLFIGNSLTFTHDVPSIVEQLSRAAGVERPIDAEMIARGGDSFYLHTERRDEGAPLQVIGRGGWDVVVLQENGRLAARSGLESFTFASRLVRAVRAVGAKPLFYMTWAYRDQPEALPRIRDTYSRIGERLEVEIAPVGDVWQQVRQSDPNLELFAPDGIHPSPEGSYLAACVIFSKLYSRSPEGLPTLDLDPDVARRLQLAASQTN